MEGVALDGERGHFGVADLDALGGGFLIELAAHGQPGPWCRGSDQCGDSTLASAVPKGILSAQPEDGAELQKFQSG